MIGVLLQLKRDKSPAAIPWNAAIIAPRVISSFGRSSVLTSFVQG